MNGTWWKRVHITIFVIMVILLPPTLLWWSESVVYLVWLSWAALAYSAIGSWQTARVEKKEDDRDG